MAETTSWSSVDQRLPVQSGNLDIRLRDLHESVDRCPVFVATSYAPSIPIQYCSGGVTAVASGILPPPTWFGRGTETAAIDTLPERTRASKFSTFPLAPTAIDDLIAEVRSGLSLNVTQFARVCLVERPTIYAWTCGSSMPREANYRRLRALWGLASLWLQKTGRPLGSLKLVEVLDGQDLLALLSADPLREVAIEQAMGVLAALPPEEGRRRGRGGREAAARLGRPTPNEDAGEAQDFLTGRRLGPE